MGVGYPKRVTFHKQFICSEGSIKKEAVALRYKNLETRQHQAL